MILNLQIIHKNDFRLKARTIVARSYSHNNICDFGIHAVDRL